MHFNRDGILLKRKLLEGNFNIIPDLLSGPNAVLIGFDYTKGDHESIIIIKYFNESLDEIHQLNIATSFSPRFAYMSDDGNIYSSGLGCNSPFDCDEPQVGVINPDLKRIETHSIPETSSALDLGPVAPVWSNKSDPKFASIRPMRYVESSPSKEGRRASVNWAEIDVWTVH